MKILLALQSLLQKTGQTLASFIKILFWSRPVRLPVNNDAELVVLGNGPSLQSFLQNHSDFLQNKRKLAVNHFADTAVYNEIKPEYYIINVPEFWTDKADEDVIKKRNTLIDNLVQKTDWKMNLLLGRGAKRSDLWDSISHKNPNIQISYFNVTPIEGFRFFNHFYFDRQLGMPRPHNVLVPSLMLGIYMKFKKIYLTGADHSWLQEIFVAGDNTVYLTQKHFYDAQTAQPDVMKKMGKGQRKLHEILHKFMLSFRGYFEIDAYAKSKNTEIVNLTPNSFIDAFKRKQL